MGTSSQYRPGTIRLQVAPEVSSLDFANGLTISGFTVPAIDTRKVKTEVELAGDKLVIGGLLDNPETKELFKIPFLVDIPVLGKFFQSQTRTRTNTELIVIVTPEIVNPIPAGAPLPEIKYPDKFLPPNSGFAIGTICSSTAGSKQLGNQPAAVPVETLVQSLSRNSN